MDLLQGVWAWHSLGHTTLEMSRSVQKVPLHCNFLCSLTELRTSDFSPHLPPLISLGATQKTKDSSL